MGTEWGRQEVLQLAVFISQCKVRQVHLLRELEERAWEACRMKTGGEGTERPGRKEEAGVGAELERVMGA